MIGIVPGSLASIWQNTLRVCLKIPDGVPPHEYVESRWACGCPAISASWSTFLASAGSPCNLPLSRPVEISWANVAQVSSGGRFLTLTPSNWAIAAAA